MSIFWTAILIHKLKYFELASIPQKSPPNSDFRILYEKAKYFITQAQEVIPLLDSGKYAFPVLESVALGYINNQYQAVSEKVKINKICIC